MRESFSAGDLGVVCETDEYFYTQAGTDPSQYEDSESLLPKARQCNFARFQAAVNEGRSPLWLIVGWSPGSMV